MKDAEEPPRRVDPADLVIRANSDHLPMRSADSTNWYRGYLPNPWTFNYKS